MASEADDAPRDVSRRDLFKTVGAGAAAAVAGAPLPASKGLAEAYPAAAPQLEALETLTAAEADILESICARLIPADENGQGAAEARAAHYIDRALRVRCAHLATLTRLVLPPSMPMRRRPKARPSSSSRRTTRMRC